MTQPMGRKPYRNPAKVDHHPGRGWVNWWEVDHEDANKTAAKREAQKEIEAEVNDPDEPWCECPMCQDTK